MKSAVSVAPGVVEIRESSAPPLAPDEVLVDVRYVGLCGSDVHYHSSGRNGVFSITEPLVLGHEAVGIVREVGADVEGVESGAPVAIHPARPTPHHDSEDERGLNLSRGGSYLGSASTAPHTQGALTETLSVRPEQLRALPDGLPLRRAALAEPLAIAIHGVDRAGSLVEGADVFVSGAGPIGCLVIAALRSRGARRIVAADVQKRALEVATACGADEVVHLGSTPLPEDEFDLVVEAAGVLPSFVGAIRAVRPGGGIIQLGILPAGDQPIPVSQLLMKEVTLFGCQRFDIEMTEALELLAHSPQLDAVITHEYPLEATADALSMAADSAQSTKVLVAVF